MLRAVKSNSYSSAREFGFFLGFAYGFEPYRELFGDIGMTISDVVEFLVIVVVIVEFGLAVAPAGEPPPVVASTLCVKLWPAADERERRIFYKSIRLRQNWTQTFSGS